MSCLELVCIFFLMVSNCSSCLTMRQTAQRGEADTRKGTTRVMGREEEGFRSR